GADRELRLEFPIPGGYRQRLSVAHVLADLRQVVLRDAEIRGDRLQLSNYGETGGIGRMHDIALIDQPQADASSDWRGDPRIVQLHLGRRDVRAIAFHRARRLTDHRLLI